MCLEKTQMTDQSCNGFEYAYYRRSNMESDEVTEEGMSPSGVKSVFLGGNEEELSEVQTFGCK